MGRAFWHSISPGVALLFAAAAFTTPAAAQTDSGEPAPVTRLVVQVTSAPTDPNVRGILAAVDARGQAVPEVAAGGLNATLDGQPAPLKFAAERPSIAIAVGLLLDSSANARVRSTVAVAVARGLAQIDPVRDVVAIASTAARRDWAQATFTNSTDDLRAS